MKLLRQLRALFRKEKLDVEMTEEIRAHLELQMDENIARGMTTDDARRAAQRAFGGVEQIKERARDERRRGLLWLDHLKQDLRYGVRGLRRHPGFAVFATLSLGLGLGVNVIVFSAVNAIVFRPLPGVGAPEELVYRHQAFGAGIYYPEYEFCREHNTVFSGLAASVECQVSPTLVDPAAAAKAGSEVERIGTVQLVSGNYFSVMRADLALGRAFLPEEDQVPGQRPVMILSHQYWQWRFRGDSSIIGRTLLVNNVAFTVVGVARESFPMEPGMIRNPWVWVPLAMSPVLEPNLDRLHAHQDGRTRVYFFGRLKPGVGWAQAKGELLNLAARYAQEFLPPDARRVLWPEFLSRGYAFFPWDKPETKAMIAAVLLLAGIVLLVACANVANLLLARATTRQREISVRLALGASRGRVVRQLLTESLLIAGLGAAVGLLIGVWCGEILWTRLLGLNLGAELQRFFGLDWHMVAFALGLALFTGVLFGLVPALEAARTSIHAALKRESTVLGQRVSRSRLRGLLVTGQVAVSVTFLILTSLALRMVLQRTNIDVGFDPQRVAFLENDAPPGSYAAQHPREFQAALLEQVRALPGVTSATIGDVWYGREVQPNTVRIDGEPATGASGMNESLVEPEFFRTINVPLVRGRLFTAEEARSHAPVFVVSESFARHFWPGQDPIGHRLQFGRGRPEGTVIGLVKDGARTIRNRYAFRPFVGDLYSPLWPDSRQLFEVWVHTETDAAATLRAVVAEARKLDPESQIRSRGTLHQLYQQWKENTLTICAVAGSLGGLALLLAAMGVYGVMAYAVAQRTHEIGVRLALGASQHGVQRLVLVEGLRLVGWGIGLGALGCAALSWFVRSRLYGLSPVDPVAFGGISLVLVLVTLAACWFPARRAARVDPMESLRCE